MVQPVTNDIGAQHTARMIRMFRDRLRIVEAERACLVGMIEELTDVLFTYRRGIRMVRAQEAADAEAAGTEQKGEAGG